MLSRPYLKQVNKDPAVLSAIMGTYLEKKRIHKRNRLQNDSTHYYSSRSSTQDVVLYNHLMDKLESLSGAVLTKHRHALNAQAWTEALNPHRRAVFAELYNNIRLGSGTIIGPSCFPWQH
jgi:hypothetical protein